MGNIGAAVVPVIRDACGQAAYPDGIAFDAASTAGAVIKEDADDEGVRVTFRAYLPNARADQPTAR
jgi:hypothetical protein